MVELSLKILFIVLLILPVIVNTSLIIYMWVVHKKEESALRYLYLIILSMTPFLNIIVFFNLIDYIRFLKKEKRKKESLIKKINSLEDLPVKLEQSFIDSFNNLLVMVTLTNQYKVNLLFVDDWQKNKYLIKGSFLYRKSNDSKHYYLFMDFNRRGELLKCTLNGKDLKLETRNTRDIILLLEDKLLRSN